MKLYTKEGWLDAAHVEAIADRNNISLIWIIGKRQIGKTYNVLKHMLDSNKSFIFMRGKQSELDVVSTPGKSPFEKIKGYTDNIAFAPDTQYTKRIIRYDAAKDGSGEVENEIGLACALSTIGNIRGFNGDKYTDVVYDEAIPEEHLLKVRHAGGAFLNMYTTVAGNRELEGKKPLRVWFLANSNSLDNEILIELNIVDIVEKMSLRGEESRILKDRGIMIILPESEVITQKRKQLALYRAIGGNSKFAQMAYGNKFSYNDFTDVAVRPLQEYNPLVVIGDNTIYLHKFDKTIYVVEGKNRNAKHGFYTDTDYGHNKFERDFPEIRVCFMRGRAIFQSMRIKNEFLHFTKLA